MLIKLKEANVIGTTYKDSAGRTVADSQIIYKDLMINSEHIVSINEDTETNRIASDKTFSRIETVRGSFVVLGTPQEVEKKISTKTVNLTSKSLLKD